MTRSRLHNTASMGVADDAATPLRLRTRWKAKRREARSTEVDCAGRRRPPATTNHFGQCDIGRRGAQLPEMTMPLDLTPMLTVHGIADESRDVGS